MHRNLTSIADLVCVGDAQWLVTAATELEAEAAGTAFSPLTQAGMSVRRLDASIDDGTVEVQFLQK